MQNWNSKDDSYSKCPGCKQDLLQSQPKVRVLLIDYSLKYLFCHQDCNIDDVIDNHFTRQMQSVKSQLEKEVQTCTNCEENGTAVSFCLDCSEWLCGVCVIAHQRVRLTKDHNIQSKENVDLQSANSLPKLLRCSIHKENNESRLIQCMACESLTEVGTHCQHCNAPVAQESNPKKIASGMDEGPPILEKEVIVLQEAIEIDEPEPKTQKSLQEEQIKPFPSEPIIDSDRELIEDEIDRTLISSSDDEYYPAKKRPKRKCKKSPVHDPPPLASLRGRGRGKGRPSSIKPLTVTSAAIVREEKKHSDSPQTSRFMQANEKQVHTSSLPIKTPPVNFGNLGDLRELSLKCRSIRIGSLKTIPQEPIQLSLNGIQMLVSNPQDINSSNCNIIIPSKDIVQIMCHFGRSLPIMYVYTNTRFSDDIVKKFGKEIYSPSGQDESKKRIIILPDKFADEDRLIIKNIFKDISVNQKRHNLFAELDVKSANALLVGSTPHEKKK